jgi:hypothetical protein
LNDDEKNVFIALVGKRYNRGRREVKLTADKFPNRIENKRYVHYILEQLVAEAKHLNATKDQYV